MSEEAARGTVEVIEPSSSQLAFARGVAESKATAPHLYLEAQVRLKSDLEHGPYAAIVWGCGLALRDCPHVNGAYRDGHFELYSRVNVGFFAEGPEGIQIPVIRDADGKDQATIAAELRELGERVRSGAITRPELSGGTFAVAGLGPHGLSRLVPIIHRGQAATLGIGGLGDQRLVATLACDQRILQGGQGAEFLHRLRECLEAPDDV